MKRIRRENFSKQIRLEASEIEHLCGRAPGEQLIFIKKYGIILKKDTFFVRPGGFLRVFLGF